MTLLIVGSTGTLGRQIVRESLRQGFEVKCLVRSFGRSAFLKKWGAVLVYGDLASPETIPTAFKGVRIVVDASTIRSSDNYRADRIEWLGKLALLESAILAKTKLFVFFTLMVPDVFVPKIPLLELKRFFIEKLTTFGLKIKSLIYHLDGFFQGLVEQYALPVLERQKIWLTKTQRKLALINSQDVAKQVLTDIARYELKLLKKPKHIVLYGLRFVAPMYIINLCERLFGNQAKTSYVPDYIIFGLQSCLRLFEFTWNIADRLQYYDLLEQDYCENTNVTILNSSTIRTLLPTRLSFRALSVIHENDDENLIYFPIEMWNEVLLGKNHHPFISEGVIIETKYEEILDLRGTSNACKRESIESYLRDYFLIIRRSSSFMDKRVTNFVESKKGTISVHEE